MPTTEQEYTEAARTVLKRMTRGRVFKVAVVLLARAARDCQIDGGHCPWGEDYTADNCCMCHVEAIERDH